MCRGYLAFVVDMVSNMQGFRAGLYSNIVANSLGFTSYEIGLNQFRDWNHGRSPTPAERGFIAGTHAVLEPAGCLLAHMLTAQK